MSDVNTDQAPGGGSDFFLLLLALGQFVAGIALLLVSWGDLDGFETAVKVQAVAGPLVLLGTGSLTIGMMMVLIELRKLRG